jgi:hypothetical protein
VVRATEAAARVALSEIQAAIGRSADLQHEIVACAVLQPAPMPDWSTEEILAVHFRMHKAEGVLFPDALAKAAIKCGLKLLRIPEKELWEEGEKALGMTRERLSDHISLIGKFEGPPWGKDQKSAALAAMIALRTFRGHD